MPRLIPFSLNFFTSNNSSGSKKYILTGRILRSFTAYVETDNVGPVLVDVYVEINGVKHMLGQNVIFDGDGYNAERLFWTGELPLSRNMRNYLYVQYANYCGTDAWVRFTGVVQK